MPAASAIGVLLLGQAQLSSKRSAHPKTQSLLAVSDPHCVCYNTSTNVEPCVACRHGEVIV